MRSLRRGDVWTTNSGVDVLLISSTVYNDISSEPTVIVVPIFDHDHDPDTGFGVAIDEAAWAAPGLITSLRKSALNEFTRQVDVQALTDVNNMLFKILATPDR